MHNGRQGERAFLYCRVSTQRQRDHGYSLDEQQRMTAQEARRFGLEIVDTIVETGSASRYARRARPKFTEMLRRLRAGEATCVVAVQADRATRDPKDAEEFLELAELGVSLIFAQGLSYLPKKGRGLSPHERYNIRQEAARSALEADILSDRAKNGMRGKAARGLWPTLAPPGYRNTTLPDGEKIIVRDPIQAPRVARFFREYAAEGLTVDQAVERAREIGVETHAGNTPSRSAIHTMLTRPMYHGEFAWDGKVYPAAFDALIPPELWERVQSVRLGRGGRSPRSKRTHTYQRLLVCGADGSLVGGETKKAKYTYYRCQGARRRGCDQPAVNVEHLEREFQRLLGELRVDDDLLAVARGVFRDLHRDAHRQGARQRAELRREEDRLTRRLQNLAASRFDGETSPEEFRRFHAVWTAELEEVQARQRATTETVQDVDEGLSEVLAVMQGAAGAFPLLKPAVRRRLLTFFFEELTLEDKRVSGTWRKGFDLWVSRTRRDADLERAGADTGTRARSLVRGCVPNTEKAHQQSAPGGLSASEGMWRSSQDESRTPLIQLPSALPPEIRAELAVFRAAA